MFKALLAKAALLGACSAACGIAAPLASAQEAAPDATSVLRAVRAAKAAAEAAEAAVAAVPAAPAELHAPPAPTAPPVLTFAAAPAQDAAPVAPQEAPSELLGNGAAMPVGSAKLLASLSAERASEAPPPTPAPLAPLAAPTLLATLGAAPVSLPSAAALEAAVAAQTTPILPPAPVYAAAPAASAPPRALYAAATYVPPRRRRSAVPSGNARFMRAVVSTAAVSVEMPDVGRQISPLGIMLGQLVTSQETPGSQYGLAEEMAMPTRPRLMSMPEVAVPQGFCSPQQRGAFMEGIYQPAMAIARHNGEVAAAYVRKLRTLYDNYQLSGDTRAQAAIAAEAKDFARTANAAGSIQEELSGQFEDIMTAPVTTCGASQ
ncbi:MAG: hypothetical protein CFE35_14240 [Novosphingobium sp. PASSN1]|nr:MAG: hypothetical protein CFE35_14240 [Novosphingobium sp. PASSN1]